ncbi:MAG: hypothetical protein MHPSP_004536, partial [Paramarteilia canceri]
NLQDHQKIVSVFATDHGSILNNHGMMSPLETNTWVAIHKNFDDTINPDEEFKTFRDGQFMQVDLLPTFAYYLGVEIPKLSTGVNLPGHIDSKFGSKLLIHLNTIYNIQND